MFLEVRKATTVIYADTLLIINFSMDFLALYISAKLMNVVPRPIRLTISAIIGAVFALIGVIIEQNSSSVASKLLWFVLMAVCAVIMAKISFGEAFKSSIVFCAVNIGLGGIMTAIYSLIGRIADGFNVEQPSTSPDASPILFACIAALSGIVSLVYGHFKGRHGKRVYAHLRAFGNEAQLNLLADSGNLLRDPISGRAVIIVTSRKLISVVPRVLIKAAEDPLGADLNELMGMAKLSLIPTNSIAGNKMLLGFIPDVLLVNKREISAVIAIDNENENYADFDGIAPESII